MTASIMDSDLFAALRVADTGVSTSFDETEKHRNTPTVFDASHCDTMEKHHEHPKHRSEGTRDLWRLEADSLIEKWSMPAAWAEGVAALKLMTIPEGAIDWRWAEIVSDAEAFATRHHEAATRTGWLLVDVFGFDPDDTGTSYALVVEIRGRRVAVLDDGTVCATGGGRRSWYRPGQGAAGTPLIWTINARRRAQQERMI